MRRTPPPRLTGGHQGEPGCAPEPMAGLLTRAQEVPGGLGRQRWGCVQRKPSKSRLILCRISRAWLCPCDGPPGPAGACWVLARAFFLSLPLSVLSSVSQAKGVQGSQSVGDTLDGVQTLPQPPVGRGRRAEAP